MTSEDVVSTPVEGPHQYGKCRDCEATFNDEVGIQEHLDATLAAAPAEAKTSHRVGRKQRALTAEEMVDRDIQMRVDDAMDDLFNKLENSRSESEIRRALKGYFDWQDAYEAFIEGDR